MENFREGIVKIAGRYDTCANDEWERHLLDGSPDIITGDIALSIAEWLESNALIEWNVCDRSLYSHIADDIRKLILPNGEGRG